MTTARAAALPESAHPVPRPWPGRPRAGRPGRPALPSGAGHAGGRLVVGVLALGLLAAGLPLLAGCATAADGAAGGPAAAASAAPGASGASAVGAAASGARAAASGPATPAPGQPPAFATVIKDATKVDGLLPIWKKDEKVWIELGEKDFGSPFFWSPKIATGIGEGPLLAGLMTSRAAAFGRPQLAEFRKVHQQVQLIARNTSYVAREGTPQARAVRSAFSPSLIGSAPLASQPHPERKTVLVEANTLLSGDLLGLGMLLQRTFRQGYAWDGRHSSLAEVRNKPEELAFDLLNHYATSSIAVPQPGGPPGGPQPDVPDTVPDARSLFATVHVSLTRLPAQPMAPRRADARVGHFVTAVADFGDDLERSPTRRWVNRWRLEKKEPAAALSPPVKPITFWIDASVPEKYRASIRAGILEWNKAFEKIGFKDAIVVQQQDDKADVDTLDTGAASVRWTTNAQARFGAIGPSHVDPRSGEILDADILIESLSTRSMRALRAQVLPAPVAGGGAAAQARETLAWARLLQAGDLAAEAAAQVGAAPSGHELAHAPALEGGAHDHGAALERCDHAELAAQQLDYALDVMAARGEFDPAGPEAEGFVQAFLKDLTMHEVGHTLGLRHNFRASRTYAERQLADPAFTASHALSGSVMEYLPVNLPRPGEAAAAPFQTTLGPYDYWAIEYAYKPIAPEREAAELLAIAGRNAEPELAFATDEDQFLGIDPESLMFDLGDDPVAYASKRLAIARDLIRRQETRALGAEDDYPRLRRSLSFALNDVARASGILTRQIGGVRTLRDRPGSGRDPLEPVPLARQRAALDALAGGVLGGEGLVPSAALQRRLAPDYLARSDALIEGEGSVTTDFSPEQAVLGLQKAVLGQLMSEGVAARLVDNQAKAPGNTLRLAELYGRLQREVWGSLDNLRGELPPLRRELQREHVARVAALLLNPARAPRSELRSLLRSQAAELQTRLAAAARRSEVGDDTRDHLRDCADSLREALTARLQRSGP